MRDAPDEEIWKYALENNFAIATKDGDFQKMSLARGAPPKVVWLRLANCSVSHLELVLREHAVDLDGFDFDTYQAILIIE